MNCGLFSLARLFRFASCRNVFLPPTLRVPLFCSTSSATRRAKLYSLCALFFFRLKQAGFLQENCARSSFLYRRSSRFCPRRNGDLTDDVFLSRLVSG